MIETTCGAQGRPISVRPGLTWYECEPVCPPAIPGNRDLYRASAGQLARDPDVDLVQPGELALRPKVRDLGIDSAQLSGEAGGVPESAPIHDEERLRVGDAQVKRNRNASPRDAIHDRQGRLTSICTDTDCFAGQYAFAVAASREQAWRHGNRLHASSLQRGFPSR